MRILARSYSNDLLTREQYIEIRARLLKKLESKGTIDKSDLKNYTKLIQDTDTPKVQKVYTSSDWIIITLGLAAAAALAFVLYG